MWRNPRWMRKDLRGLTRARIDAWRNRHFLGVGKPSPYHLSKFIDCIYCQWHMTCGATVSFKYPQCLTKSKAWMKGQYIFIWNLCPDFNVMTNPDVVLGQDIIYIENLKYRVIKRAVDKTFSIHWSHRLMSFLLKMICLLKSLDFFMYCKSSRRSGDHQFPFTSPFIKSL